jgi:hypothetical protein
LEILIISQTESIHTSLFADGFIRKGHKIKMLSTTINSEKYNYQGVKFVKYNTIFNKISYFFFKKYLMNYKLYSKSLFNPYIIIKLINHFYLIILINKVLKKETYDCVFSMNLSTNGLLASRIRNSKIKSCFTLGADLANHNKYSLKYFFNLEIIKNYAVKKLNYIFSADKETIMNSSIKDVFNKYENKFIIFNHFGIKVDKFNPNLRSNSKKIDLFKINKNHILAICFRPPRRDFNFEEILKSIKIILGKYPNFYFAIGTGGVNVDYLKIIIDELNISNNILLFDNISYADLPYYIAQGDIYIDPIDSNKSKKYSLAGVSGSLLESMSCALIPVVSNRLSIKWIIPDEAKKFIFGDFKFDLLEKLELAIKERNNQKIKNACRNAVVKKANWDKNINLILELMRY